MTLALCIWLWGVTGLCGWLILILISKECTLSDIGLLMLMLIGGPISFIMSFIYGGGDIKLFSWGDKKDDKWD